VNFAEQPPSQRWAALKHRGESIAGVWFKPEGDPSALLIRIPRKSFDLPDIGQQMTPEHLLRAVGISAVEVESWHHDGDPGSIPELDRLLAAPPGEVTHSDLRFTLKSPAPVSAPEVPEESEIPEEKWQYLEGRWDAILNVESSINAMRLSAESLRAEMEASARKTLILEEKANALSADLAVWNKAKSRIRYAVPKLREFIHRATWAAGAAERKQVEDYVLAHVRPRLPMPEWNRVVALFDSLLKNRQVLAAQGVQVAQEGRSILNEVEGSLRTLQRNSASNAARKKGSTGRR
jgi:hypothetical protein